MSVDGVLHGQRFSRDADGVLSTLEQVAARRQEIEDVRRNLEREEAELDMSLEPQARKKAREV